MTAARASLDVPAQEVADTVRRWMVTELSASHPLLGRPGPVCPYLPAALARDLVVVRSRNWDPAETDAPAAVAALIDDAITLFRTRTWPQGLADLRCVVAVLPQMPRRTWPLVDTVHATVKPTAAQQGLMVGQFHPDSPTGAVHNPGFRILRSPYPLFVIRAMALHDILFLHDHRAWFAAYQQRFGDRYAQTGSPVALAALYDCARARFGDADGDADADAELARAAVDVAA